MQKPASKWHGRVKSPLRGFVKSLQLPHLGHCKTSSVMNCKNIYCNTNTNRVTGSSRHQGRTNVNVKDITNITSDIIHKPSFILC